MRAYIAALTVLLAAGCTPAVPASLKPTPPVVDCRKPDAGEYPAAPREDEWVEYRPASPGYPQGVARLSEAASTWILAVMGVARRERALRAQEHACEDGLRREGVIR